MGPTETKGNKI